MGKLCVCLLYLLCFLKHWLSKGKDVHETSSKTCRLQIISVEFRVHVAEVSQKYRAKVKINFKDLVVMN